MFLCSVVRRKENVPTDAFLALSENVTLKLTFLYNTGFAIQIKTSFGSTVTL